MDLMPYLKHTAIIDSDSPLVIECAFDLTAKLHDPIEKSIVLYHFVRDEIPYFAYGLELSENAFRASTTLEKGKGHCIQKSGLLVALHRSIDIPAGIGYARVWNNQCMPKFEAFLGTKLMVPHAFAYLGLRPGDNPWIKATPSFDSGIYKNLDMRPLEFNGKDNSFFPLTNSSGLFMEYEYFYQGDPASDICLDFVKREFKKYYGHFFDKRGEFDLNRGLERIKTL